MGRGRHLSLEACKGECVVPQGGDFFLVPQSGDFFWCLKEVPEIVLC